MVNVQPHFNFSNEVIILNQVAQLNILQVSACNNWYRWVITDTDERLCKPKLVIAGQIELCSSMFWSPFLFLDICSLTCWGVPCRLRVNCVGVMDILTLPTMDQASIQNYIQHWQVRAVDWKWISVESCCFFLCLPVLFWACLAGIRTVEIKPGKGPAVDT